MDLATRLPNLTLAQIASLLNSKQQEVLLASISVAARFIQQLQADEQQFLQDEQQFLQDEQQFLHEEQQFSKSNNDHQFSQDEQQFSKNEQQPFSQDQQPFQLTTNNNEEQKFSRNNRNNNNNNSTSNLNLKLNLNSNDDQQQSQHYTHDNESFLAEDDDMTPIKKFAEELKNRRKLIRLSQKGAAQSLRAFSGGQEPCTDAIIYHFENLQMEPQKAIRLIPLLRDWLDWAEKHKMSGKPLPMMSAIAKVPRERKRKVVLFNDKAKQYLENAFLKNNHPDRYQLDVISQELNIPTRSIRKWFTNRRQRKRFAEKFSFSE